MIIYSCRNCDKQYRLHSPEDSLNVTMTEKFLCYQCENYRWDGSII